MTAKMENLPAAPLPILSLTPVNKLSLVLMNKIPSSCKDACTPSDSSVTFPHREQTTAGNAGRLGIEWLLALIQGLDSQHQDSWKPRLAMLKYNENTNNWP